MNWVYVQSEKVLWTTGHYKPNGDWCSESDHSTRAEAAARVHYLNGGNTAPTQALVTAAQVLANEIEGPLMPTMRPELRAIVRDFRDALAPFQEEQQ